MNNIFIKMLADLPEAEIKITPKNPKDNKVAQQLSSLITHHINEERKKNTDEIHNLPKS
jgi:hypothetical protein